MVVEAGQAAQVVLAVLAVQLRQAGLGEARGGNKVTSRNMKHEPYGSALLVTRRKLVPQHGGENSKENENLF